MVRFVMKPVWYKVGVQMPREWHDSMNDLADEVQLDLRVLYMVAVDLVTAMDPALVKERGRELRDLSEDDFQGLAQLAPTKRAARRAARGTVRNKK